MNNIYFSTVLLDNQRWTKEKNPSLPVSTYYEALLGAGFSGIELWEFHYTNSSKQERTALEAQTGNTPIYNVYCTMADADAERRDKSLEIAGKIGATGIKFNTGGDPSKWDEYVRNCKIWRDQAPDNLRLLCECHPGTVIEEADEARKFFDQVGMEKFGIIVHPFSRHESLREWMELFGPHVSHMHLQMRDPVDEDKFVLFEEREDVVEDSLRILREEGFFGTYSLEFTKGTRTKNDRQEILFKNAIKDLNYIKGML